MSGSRPAICLIVGKTSPADLRTAFLLGCEEEGVPVESRVAGGNACELSREGAAASELFVGAGIDDSGTIAVHERRLGERPPVILIRSAATEDARRAGGDAARLVLGRRLRFVPEHQSGETT